MIPDEGPHNKNLRRDTMKLKDPRDISIDDLDSILACGPEHIMYYTPGFEPWRERCAIELEVLVTGETYEK